MRVRSLWIVGSILAALLITVGCQGPFGVDATLTITGTISMENADDAVTMAGISVVERGITEQPASDGTFTVAGLAPGDYVLEIAAPGYVPITREVSAPDGGEYPVGELELAVSDAIYVTAGGNDSNNGLTGDAPVASLHKALRLAKLHGLTSIKVAGGTYDLGGDSLPLGSPVGITGGYNASNWDQQDAQSYETIITGAADVITIGAVSGALVQDVTLRPDPTTEGYSRGFNIYGSNAWINGVSVDPPEEDFFQFEALGIFHGSSVEVTDSYLQVPDTQDHANGIHPMHGSYVKLNNTELVVGYAGHDSGALGIHVTENSMAELYNSSITMASSAERNIGILAEDGGQVFLLEESTVESGASANDASYGIELYQNASATIENSSVRGGASDLESAGILVGGVSTASILGNDVIRGGPLAGADVTDSQSAGIIVRSISGAVRIVENSEISGPTGDPVDTDPSRRPDRTFGIFIAERANAVIAENTTISGGLGRSMATGIGGWDFSGAVEIQNNGTITAGEVLDPRGDVYTDTRGIDLGTDDPTAYVRIIGNHVDGGVVARPENAYGGSTGVSLHGPFSATIVDNLIDGGTVENLNESDFEVDPDGYFGGPTVVSPGAADVVLNRNTLQVLTPKADVDAGNPVFVRGIHGGAAGTELTAKNNQVLLYNVDGPIHAFEPEQYSSFTVTNNTVILQVDNDDTGDSYTADAAGLWASHTGSSIRLTNNLWYFPNPVTFDITDDG
ncbi:MAG: right-handed parallel beta-helix repeat-containing protein, partial [Spirochaetaceae bacterium]